jgi:hypothetical protein
MEHCAEHRPLRVAISAALPGKAANSSGISIEAFWRAETGKIGNDHWTPATEEVVALLAREQQSRREIGDAYIFPTKSGAVLPAVVRERLVGLHIVVPITTQ